MCKALLDLFRPPKIPHPEEPENPGATMDNVDMGVVMGKWFHDWEVPMQYREWWQEQIVITLDPNFSVDGKPYPAGTYDGPDGKRYLICRPSYLNPGVIAHEQAHNSYAYLTDKQKTDFEAAFYDIRFSDRMLKYLFRINSYGLSSSVEGHAEVYRYCGQEMPVGLKGFYPKLIGG